MSRRCEEKQNGAFFVTKGMLTASVCTVVGEVASKFGVSKDAVPKEASGALNSFMSSGVSFPHPPNHHSKESFSLSVRSERRQPSFFLS